MEVGFISKKKGFFSHDFLLLQFHLLQSLLVTLDILDIRLVLHQALHLSYLLHLPLQYIDSFVKVGFLSNNLILDGLSLTLVTLTQRRLLMFYLVIFSRNTFI